MPKKSVSGPESVKTDHVGDTAIYTKIILFEGFYEKDNLKILI